MKHLTHASGEAWPGYAANWSPDGKQIAYNWCSQPSGEVNAPWQCELRLIAAEGGTPGTVQE